jgi:hypothetical protein
MVREPVYGSTENGCALVGYLILTPLMLHDGWPRKPGFSMFEATGGLVVCDHCGLLLSRPMWRHGLRLTPEGRRS